MRVVLASGNAGKLAELTPLLKDSGIELVSAHEAAVAGAEETGSSFAENALLKARHAARACGCAALADDSGLEVDVLGGAPGIHSARFAGANADDRANNQKLLEALAGTPPERRSARYRCVLALVRSADDANPLLAEGVWEGRIIDERRGARGFGYDPHFWLPALDKTAAELDATMKNCLSHRGQAVRELVAQLRGRR